MIMRKRRLKKTLAFIVMMCMVFTMAYTPLGAAYAATSTVSTWTLLDGIEDAAESEHPVAITMTKTSTEKTYLLTASTTSSAPAAAEAAVDGNTLTVEDDGTLYGWTITPDTAEGEPTGTYSISNSSGSFLYLTAANNGVRVGKKPDVGAAWSISEEGYLSAVDSANAARRMGVYLTTPDWRCYTTVNNNITGQELRFWELTGTEDIEEPDVETTAYDKLTSEPVDGAKVAIYHPASGMALTANASGSKLAGTAGTIEEGKLAVTEDAAILDVSEVDGAYQFTAADGKVLTSGATGNSLTFADDAASDLAKWTFEEQADGTWYVKNVGANFNGNHNQALEYYNGFTTYGVKADNAAYKFEFYGEQGVKKISKIGFAPQNGASVAIYHPKSGMTLTANASGSKLAGAAATVEDGKMIVTEDLLFLAVSLEDDVYTFTAPDGKVLTSGATGNSLTFADDAASDLAKWKLEEQTDGTWYVKNVGANYNGNYNQALEYYNGFTTYGVKANNADYKFEFYGTSDPAPEDPPEPPTGDDFGLVSSIETGDEVILYNAASKMGVGNTVASNKITGISLADTDGVITTDNEAAVWTAAVNEDGTYTFTQGDYTLGGVTVESNGKIYNNLVPTGAAYTKWTLTGPDEADFNYFMYLGDIESSYGNVYLEYYNGFTLYGSSNPDKTAFGIQFYKKGAEPETPSGGGPGETGDQITDLSKLEDGQTIAIYSPGHRTAVSTKPNGDWYLKANPATVEEGKVKNFTADFVWKVAKNDDGTYSFYANDDESHSITVWKSDTYAELSLNVGKYPDNKWTLAPAKTAGSFYFYSPTVSGDRGPAYIEAYVRNEADVFSGYFTSPTATNFKESEFALQMYAVDPEDAVPAIDDGEWDGVLTPGKQYVMHNVAADAAVGLYKEANYSFDAIAPISNDNPAEPGNGAYVFTVGSMGRYYSFEMGGKYLASNNEEELFLTEPNDDGSVPENAKWFLNAKDGGYIIYNKDASYNGTPVCIEYYSSVFSGWTFSPKNDINIYLFNFVEPAEGTFIHEGVVQVPSAEFDCENFRYVEQDFPVTITLDDLCPDIEKAEITFTVEDGEGIRTETVTDYEVSSDGKNYTFTIPAEAIDGETPAGNFEIAIAVTNGYGISYESSRIIGVIDLPFFEDITPPPASQTGDDLRPVISARVRNAGTDPVITMKINGEEIQDFKFENGVVSYKPAEDLATGKTTVELSAKRTDARSGFETWSFTAGKADYELYFGQLHSHTTYSDGSGSLDTAPPQVLQTLQMLSTTRN